jgi:hypothetical protein
VAPRLCVYTVLVGRYERLLDQDGLTGDSVDLICFTDDPELTSDTWDVRLIDPVLPADPNRSSREHKILAHRALPDHDVSIYVDNSLQLLGDPRELVAALLPDGVPMASVRHSWHADVASEMAVCVDTLLDAPSVIHEQRTHYEQTCPGAVHAPLLWNGILLRRHHDALVVQAMELWWQHVLRYSRRDQLSLPAVLLTVSLQPLVHELDNHESPWWHWPREAGRVRNSPLLADGPEALAVQLRAELDAAVHLRNLTALEVRRLEAELEQRQARLSQEVEAHQETLGRLVERSAHADQGDRDRELLHGWVGAARADAEHASHELARVQDQLDQLQASVSWRITRPLRDLRRRWPAG